MNRVALKTRIYLDENVKAPFGFNRQGWNFCRMENLTKDDFYDYFTMTGCLLDLDGKYVFWIGTDIGGISPLLFDAVLAKLNTVTDKLDGDRLIMNGTHTHSGPGITNGHMRPGQQMKPEDIYSDFIDHMAETAKGIFLDCEKDLKEYDSCIGVVPIEGCYGNRNSLDLPSDKDINLICFTEKGTDKKIGMLMEMATHSTIIFPKNPKLSVDLVGNVRSSLADYFGCPVLPVMGCAGDSSTRLTRERSTDPALDYSELCRLVKEVVAQVKEKASFEPMVIDRFEIEKCSVAYEYYQNPESMKKRLVLLEKQIEEEKNPQQLRLLVQSKESLEKNILGPDFHAQDTLLGRAYNFGELKIAVFPGELVSSLGLKIISHKPGSHHLVMGYTQDNKGYLVEIEEYGKNFESINSKIPVGLPEVLTEMLRKKVEEFEY